MTGTMKKSNSLPDAFPDIRKSARLRLLRLYHEAGSGHIGGSLSCLDALLTLHHAAMSDEDRFLLSKGHSAGALYVTLWSLGLLSDERMSTFTRENTLLPGHPSGKGIPGLLFPTGSLGHGPSLAAGLALALRHKGGTGRVFCLCSDGEWQEGSCWEALIFAVSQGLDNLCILVDQNGLQGFGTTLEVARVSDLAPRFKAFGASVVSVEGHAPEAILHALAAGESGRPHIVVLHTHKGLGLHFEDKLESHYLPLTDEQYAKGVQRIHAEEGIA
ncbi:transketolase, N-terminal subunit [Betaproteobacteria bacterium]|nr:transketolase, N-terminal subunit [Betaproteobacteria bacterium]